MGGTGIQAAAALDAVLGGVGLQGFGVGDAGEFLQQERFQAHRAGVGALAAADAGGLGGAAGLLFREEEQGARALEGGRVEVRDRLAHHRTAADDLRRIGRHSAEGVDDIADRRAHAHLQVRLLREAFARHGDGVVDEGLVLLHGLVHGEGGAHVLDDGAHRDRQAAGTHLAVHHRVDELLLAALRVTHLHLHHLEVLEAQLRDDLADMGDGFRLVLLDGDGAGDVPHHLREDGGADDRLLALLQEDAVVGGEVRLAFAAVDDHALALGARRRRELDVRRERRAAEADDTGAVDLLDDGLVVGGNLRDEVVRQVDALHPLVAFHGDLDVGDGTAGQVGAGADGLDRTGHGGVDVGRHETARAGNHLAHLHLVAHLHDREGGRAEVLGDGNVHGRRRRQDFGPAVAGELVVVRMDSADGECTLTHGRPPLLLQQLMRLRRLSPPSLSSSFRRYGP